jgi:hypothetical protein
MKERKHRSIRVIYSPLSQFTCGESDPSIIRKEAVWAADSVSNIRRKIYLLSLTGIESLFVRYPTQVSGDNDPNNNIKLYQKLNKRRK